MPQQRTDYPLDYSRGGAETAKERERGMADAATDRMKDAAESSHDIASNVAEKVREYGEEAQAAGVLCGKSKTRDVIDASVVLLGRRHRAKVVTSDPKDLLRIDPSLETVQC